MRKRAFEVNGKTVAVATGVILSSYVIKSLISKVLNNAHCKAIIDDMKMNDPVLKNVDKATLLEWYATIYHFSPSYAKDKNAVRAMMLEFARHGKIDVAMLKTLTGMEKDVAASTKSNLESGAMNPLSLKDIVGTVGTVGALLPHVANAMNS